MQNKSNKKAMLYGYEHAKMHYQRMIKQRQHLDLCLLVHDDYRRGLRLINRTRHNQHTKRQLAEYLGNYENTGQLHTLRDAVRVLHGRLCVPHPLRPESLNLAAWISYDEAQSITGRARRTLYRWRLFNASPDPAAWRLLEIACHGVEPIKKTRKKAGLKTEA